MRKKQIIAMLLAVCMMGLTACQASGKEESTVENQGEKTFVYGTTGYGVEMGDEGLNPHKNYSGWSVVRYGVAETLVRLNDQMELEPWLATSYEFVDENTCVIQLRENVYFSSGRLMDAKAVKECFEDLISVHERAAADLKIASIDAEGQTLTIHTTEACPALLHFLADPYSAIIDMQAGIQEDENVSGTGPYVANSVSDTEILLDANPNYWNGSCQVEHVDVKTFTDGDSLTMALQTGEIDGAYGLPYVSYPLFSDEDQYSIKSMFTSRVFFLQLNQESEALKDEHVRHAIAAAIDKESFVNTLLEGHGSVAEGPFPEGFFGSNESVVATEYNQEEAKESLALAGYEDNDGDGYVEKDGETLTIQWLTYPGRMELPLLAEAAQADLKEIGIKVEVNSSSNHLTELEKENYDIYASAMVTAPTGDGEYFFRSCTLEDSSKNYSHSVSSQLESLEEELHVTFDESERCNLLMQMQQELVEEENLIFVSYLEMSIVTRKGISGICASTSDYYEITADLKMED